MMSNDEAAEEFWRKKYMKLLEHSQNIHFVSMSHGCILSMDLFGHDIYLLFVLSIF